jgi:predicted nuclease of predicted toxin-antitoxin system
MKFLLDQDVYVSTLKFLQRLGHDVLPVAQLGLATADDEVLLQRAHSEGRIFVTRDRDFGNLVFVKAHNTGVLYLRIRPTSEVAVHRQLEEVLNRYSEDELRRAFLVVEPSGFRFRQLPGVKR